MRELFGRVCTSVLVLSASFAAFAAVEPLPPLQLQPKHPAISTNVAKLIEELHYSLASPRQLPVVGDSRSLSRSRSTATECISPRPTSRASIGLRYELDDRTRTGDLQPVFDIFNLFRKRAGERVEGAIALLATEPDYTLDETFQWDRSELPWPASDDEIAEVWRKNVKSDGLRLMLTGKTWAEAAEIAQGALRAFVPPHHAAHDRRRFRNLHERRRAQHGSALELSVAAPERGVSDSDEPVVRRHRRVAAARGRLRQGHEHHSRRPRGHRRAAETRGPHHRRR